MDRQGRVQLPPEWLSGGERNFVAAIGEPHSSAISVFPATALSEMFPAFAPGDYNRDRLRVLAKQAKDFRNVTVDGSGRLPLTDPALRARLADTEESTLVTLEGALKFFYIVPSSRHAEVEADITKA